MDDGDRVGGLYSSIKSILKDQFVVEKVLSECTESELRILEDICSRCTTYQQQDFFIAPNVARGAIWKNLVWNLLGRSRR